MSDIVIRCENLSKQYRIGSRERYKTLRDTLTDAMYAPLRALCSGFNGHGSSTSAAPTSNLRPPISNHIWALKDVSFEVKQGEVVGIIGRNGAGKSTLLKILSRITEPTEGHAEIHGRVGSLLEVGTGFHPELTGRENIYLNGAILGMKKAEIERKFDEIVAFAEVEKFIDTPVKHYSSGMYVRLAFAVAAHLEPEILVVDEVLAVGDAEFQGKCLGKMHDVSKGGRTVLFVSHNMAAVKSLTTRSVVLTNGLVAFSGPTIEAIAFYTKITSLPESRNRAKNWGRGTYTAIRAVNLLDENGSPTHVYLPARRFRLAIELETEGFSGLSLEVMLLDMVRTKLGLASLHQFDGQTLPSKPGIYQCELNLESLPLASGNYSLDVTTSIVNSNWDHYVESALEFEVPFFNPQGRSWDFKQTFGYGAFALVSSVAPQIRGVNLSEK